MGSSEAMGELVARPGLARLTMKHAALLENTANNRDNSAGLGEPMADETGSYPDSSDRLEDLLSCHRHRCFAAAKAQKM